MTRTIAVLGAGPVGLEAALQGVTLGYDVTVFEAGRVGENLERWGHVTLFSPWRMNHTPLGLQAVGGTLAAGRGPASEDLLTGREHRRIYLEPLARSVPLRGRIREGHRVVSISREGLLKGERLGDSERASARFRLLVETSAGEETFLADAVVDATGSYGHPNWLGDGGIPAPGERGARDRISYLLDDPLGTDRERYRGKAILLVGGGLSAATSLAALERLAVEEPGTSLWWATRGTQAPPYREFPDDPLPGRAAVMRRANALSTGGTRIQRRAGYVVDSIVPAGDVLNVTLHNSSERETHRVDRILANVGYRPDRSLYSELQVHECYASDGPIHLAASLLKTTSGGDCLAQLAPGPDSLRNPEPGFFILGAKSYGRNSLFLMRVGFEQVRGVFQILTGRADLNRSARAVVGS